MNERIRELAEQAWDSTRDEFGSFVDDGGEVNWDFLHAYDKKFVELIVRGCCDWIDGSPTNESGQLLLTRSFIIANLKGHFGVEE